MTNIETFAQDLSSIWKFFAPADGDRNKVVCYNKEKCEKCGSTIYNDACSSHNFSVPGADIKSVLFLAGMTFENRLPPNLVVDFHDDDNEGEEWGCENCM